MPKNPSSSWLPILLLVAVLLALLSPKTAAIVGQPVPSCSSLVQAAAASCNIGDGLFRKVSASIPFGTAASLTYVQDVPSGKLYRLLSTDPTTAKAISLIPDGSQVGVIGLLTIPSASTDSTYNFAGDISVQGISELSTITQGSYTIISVSTSIGSVVTVTPNTYTILATVPGGYTTMIETVTGGTYTLTGTAVLATIFPGSSPSLACPVGEYRDENVRACLPNPVKPIVAAFVKFLNWLRCLFGCCS
jgi:hypothetical protein